MQIFAKGKNREISKEALALLQAGGIESLIGEGLKFWLLLEVRTDMTL